MSKSPNSPDDQVPYIETGVSDNTNIFHAVPDVHYVYKNYQADKQTYHENPFKANDLLTLDLNYKLLYDKRRLAAQQKATEKYVKRFPIHSEKEHPKNVNQHQCFLVGKESVGKTTTIVSSKDRTKEIYLQKLKLSKSISRVKAAPDKAKSPKKNVQITQKEMVFGLRTATPRHSPVPQPKGRVLQKRAVSSNKQPKSDEFINNRFEIIANKSILNDMNDQSGSFSLAKLLNENMKELELFSDMKDAVFSVLVIRRHELPASHLPTNFLNPSFAGRVLRTGSGTFSEDLKSKYNPSLLLTGRKTLGLKNPLDGVQKPLQDLSAQTILELDENKVLPTNENEQEVIDRITRKTFGKLRKGPSTKASVTANLRTTVQSNDSSKYAENEFKMSLQKEEGKQTRNTNLGLNLDANTSLSYKVSVNSYSNGKLNDMSDMSVGRLQGISKQSSLESSSKANSFGNNEFGSKTEFNGLNYAEGSAVSGNYVEITDKSSQVVKLARDSSKSSSRKATFLENHNKVEKITEHDLVTYYNDDTKIFGDARGKRLSEIP